MEVVLSIVSRFKKSSEDKAIEAYDLGLQAKYAGNWRESFVQNQRADKLRPGDGATLWNLGIAATALREWDEARRAWKACGVDVNEGPGEVLMPRMTGCVRLNPQGDGEVVWGTRLDPARTLVASVPLPGSNRRCADIILHDGAPEGHRIWNGQQYPVFDELAIWRMSEYSTFEVELQVPNQAAFESLVKKCQQMQFGIEDWGTIRMLCEACSKGLPVEHVCTAEASGMNSYGIAVRSEAELRELLKQWVELENGAGFGRIELKLRGVSY
jgi:hypothetical protein